MLSILRVLSVKYRIAMLINERVSINIVFRVGLWQKLILQNGHIRINAWRTDYRRVAVREFRLPPIVSGAGRESLIHRSLSLTARLHHTISL